MLEKSLNSKKRDKQHSDYALISQVAHMYYDQGMLQPEIAQKLYFSRSKVSRMLTRAVELGIVDIKVRRIVDRVASLEKELCQRFNLSDAIVISNFETENEIDAFDSLSDFAALHISSLLEGTCRVGVSNGRMVNAVVKKCHKVQPCSLEIVQLVGAVSNTFMAEESRQLVNEMLATYSGKGYFLNTPLYIDDQYAKAVLLQNPSVKEVFQHMIACDYIITGIGGLISDLSEAPQWNGYLTKEHIETLKKDGAIGSICEQYYDIDGNLTSSVWNQSCIGISFEDIKKNPMTIGIAIGEEKILPILGALRGKLLNSLITNATTASRVLEEQTRQIRTVL